MSSWRDRETDLNLNCTIPLNLMKQHLRMLCHVMNFNVPFHIIYTHAAVCGCDSSSKTAALTKITIMNIPYTGKNLSHKDKQDDKTNQHSHSTIRRYTAPRGTSDKCTQRSNSRRLPLRLHKTFCFKLQANVQTSKTEINKQVCAGSAVARRAQGLRGPGRAPLIPSALPPAHVHCSSCIRQSHTRQLCTHQQHHHTHNLYRYDARVSLKRVRVSERVVHTRYLINDGGYSQFCIQHTCTTWFPCVCVHSVRSI